MHVYIAGVVDRTHATATTRHDGDDCAHTSTLRYRRDAHETTPLPVETMSKRRGE